LAVRSQSQLRGYVYEFIEMFSPHLTPDVVRQSVETQDKKLQDELFDRYVKESSMR